ncbi:IS3 family transposase [Bacteroidota bacterium]
MMTKQRQFYDREFKEKAVELSFARGNAKKIAEELGIRPELLYRWRREYQKYEKNSFPGHGKPKMTDLERENARLQKELREAKMERDNLKKGGQHLLQERWKIYQFMSDHRTRFTIEMMCKVFKVKKSSYYQWLQNGSSARWHESEKLLREIMDIFEASNQTYGSPRITAELRSKGWRVSVNRVAKMMRAAGIRARKPKRFVATTDSKHNYPVAPNLLEQEFHVTRPGEVWVSDITYVRTKSGWLYLTVIIDLYDRKVIGWSMSTDLSAGQTIIPAWLMATWRRPVREKLIFHSDRGIQYACKDFSKLLAAHKQVARSMSRKGNCWDNAVAESFFKTIKVEWVYTQNFVNQNEAQLSIFQWIESWYNRKRRHSALGYKTIDEYNQINTNFTNAA